MHQILRKKILAKDIYCIEFLAEDLACAAKPGQFLILRVDEKGERFPLTIFDFDLEAGTITVVCQAVGVSTKKLCGLKEGDAILDVAGPLGKAVETQDIGKVICIGGGVGTAEAYPIARAFKQAGNEVNVIIGARSKELVICEELIRGFCQNIHITTDDGSYGRQGFVTDVLRELLSQATYDLVYAIGPIPMMKSVTEITRELHTKTLISLNTVMIDGTGMCGGCRLNYDGQRQFTCVDGPEFDGHLVDFDDLLRRNSRYRDKEKQSMEHHCRLGLKD